jgi:hypothetical protein
MNRRWVWAVLLLAAGLGCAARPADTGAREVVQDYYEALARQDWPQAYADLHPDSRRRWSADQFARLAQGYRRGVGFEPDGVRIRSCEEHGGEAVAHVVLTGPGPAGQRGYRDAVTLRRDGDRWGVELPPQFGRAGAR